MGLIRKAVQVPTGHIIIVDGYRGPLECLSLGDYGKENNIKADFLGLPRPLHKVEHGKMLPLEEKWVITISTQYGCSMGCRFCDVPKVGPGYNASSLDMLHQVDAAMSLHPEVTHSSRLNLHFARMGEPTYNPDVFEVVHTLRDELPNFHLHPVISTMMPSGNRELRQFLMDWMDLKNLHMAGEAGLQLSINSTEEDERVEMFNGMALSLPAISGMLSSVQVRGRKITLNFAVAEGYTVDAEYLRRLFDPERFMCKLTPMHKTTSCTERGIQTPGDYTTYAPYHKLEQELREQGFDVLVFIASEEEDQGMITCGNAILAGRMPSNGTLNSSDTANNDISYGRLHVPENKV